MNKRILRNICIVLFAVGTASGVWAENKVTEKCDMPTPPAVPDGSAADREAMASAGAAVKSFVADTQSYLKCLEENESRYGRHMSHIEQKELDDVYNGAVDAMKATAREFNTQLRNFRRNNA